MSNGTASPPGMPNAAPSAPPGDEDDREARDIAHDDPAAREALLSRLLDAMGEPSRVWRMVLGAAFAPFGVGTLGMMIEDVEGARVAGSVVTVTEGNGDVRD